jgi:hypothetical protein
MRDQQMTLAKIVVYGILLCCTAPLAARDSSLLPCGRSCVVNGGHQQTDEKTTLIPNRSQRDQPNQPDLTEAELVDHFAQLIQKEGSFQAPEACIPGVSVKIWHLDNQYWAKIDDRVFVRRPSDPNRRRNRCFFAIEDRFKDPIPLFASRDLHDPNCQEFRGYRDRRMILRIRNRSFNPNTCAMPDFKIRNTQIGSFYYQGARNITPPARRYLPDDARDETLEVSGWDYNQTNWPNDKLEYLGDFNSKTIVAVIDLDHYEIRSQFERYMAAKYWHVQPALSGYVRQEPVVIEASPNRAVEVPYLYITNMKISHREYVQGF